MKKPFSFLELSNKKCIVCGCKLKKNLVEKNPDADRCFEHHMQQVRKNPRYEFV